MEPNAPVNSGSDDPLSRPEDSLTYDATQTTSAFTQPISSAVEQPEYISAQQKNRLKARLRMVLLISLALLVVGGGVFTLIRRGSRDASQMRASSFGDIRLPLSGVLTSGSSADSKQSLKVNGRLQVGGSIILTPTLQPSSPIAGQLYFDQTSSRLAYYDGQQFITVEGSTPSSGSVTNIFGGAGSSATTSNVLLQSSSPGIQQTGNFNIAGTGIVGALSTSVIESAGGALFVNPTAVSTPSLPSGTTATLGPTTIGSSTTPPGWNSVLSATKVTMGDTGGVAKSISVNFVGGSSSSHVQLAIYDDDGDIPSKPGALLATSAIGNLVPNGLTTLTVPSIGLSANATYWLAVNTDDTNTTRTYNGGNKSSCFISSSFGFMPDPFSSFGCFFDNSVYTIFATYVASSGTTGFNKAQLTLSATGQALFQNTEDSGTAFQIQNAAGSTTVFNVDTVNNRIAIGKAAAAYKLDIAGGDINLSNGRSLRFGGIQVVSVSGAGTTTSISNFLSGGTVSAQSDNFIVQDANATHHSLAIDSNGAATFSNRVNSATAFRVQNAANQDLVTVDTAGGNVTVKSTGTGALTLTSAVSATWGIGTATSGVGGDLTVTAGHGATAGNNDGGDLFLQGGAPGGTGVPGSVIVKPQNDSADAFQVQNSTGTPLLVADSSGMKITVSGTDTTYSALVLTNTHFGSTQTTAPTIGTPSSCGTSPTAVIDAGSTDTAGSITITTGTGSTASTCDTTVAFHQAYGAAPKSILVVGKTDAASAARQVYVSSAAASTFTISFGTSAGGANSTTYSFSYWVIE